MTKPYEARVAKGAVSGTGYGDGAYPAYVYRDRTGEIVKVEVRFDEDEEDKSDGDNG